MRRVRHELPSLLAVLLLPAVALCAFPWSALTFRPRASAAAAPAFAAFVTLTPEQEAQAMRRAKTASTERADVAVPHADLILDELPDDVPQPVARLEDRARPPEPERPTWRPGAWQPSLAAPPPETIPADDEAAPELAFPRASLLRLPDPGAARRSYAAMGW